MELFDKIIDSFQFDPSHMTIKDPEDVSKYSYTEIPYEELTFGKPIGKGGYSTVYQGLLFIYSFIPRTWKGMDVAHKVLYTNVNYELIKKETRKKRKIRHKNILPLYGVSRCEKGNQTEYILVLELADYSLDVVTQTYSKK